jgi:hypothetical protein
VENVLSGVTAAAVELIPAAAEVGVLLITQNRKFETHAATSQHVHHLHVLRERFCNGSALQAALYGAPIVCTTTSRPSADGRSTPVPSWTWGIRSAMSVGLYTVGRTAGSPSSEPNPAHSAANPERSAQCLARMVPRRCRPAVRVNNSSPRWPAEMSSAKPKAF